MDILDDLKKLVSLFIICKLEVSIASKQFEGFVKVHGHFRWEVTVQVVRRVP